MRLGHFSSLTCFLSVGASSMLGGGCASKPAPAPAPPKTVEIVTSTEREPVVVEVISETNAEEPAPTPESPIAIEEPPPTPAELLAWAVSDWAPTMLRIEASGEPVQFLGDGDVVEVVVPCRMSIDQEAAIGWTRRVSAILREAGFVPRERRVLAGEGDQGVQPPPGVAPPLMDMASNTLAASDDARRFALVLADREGWGAAADVFVLDRSEYLPWMLEEIAAPREVQMLAYSADGMVIHGTSVPLLPRSMSRAGLPQDLVCPWWFRDRRQGPAPKVVWRNAQQWLAPGRTLAAAFTASSGSVGDVMFLPMLGWQRTSSASPLAVGSLVMPIRFTLDRSTANRIDRFEFRVVEVD